MAKKSIDVTVFIPTFNGDKYLADVLKAIYRQRTEKTFEVLIIDSGSADGTLEIIERYQKKYSNLRLKEIPNSEFGHGKTRNLAAQLARGEFIVFLTQDAIPAHKDWLNEMLAPFDITDKVAAVLGKQDPRRHCFPLMKYDIQAVFSHLGPDHAGIVLYHDGSFIKSQATRDLVTFYSDVNSATRRSFLLNTIAYRDVRYAEDQLFGQDIIRAGYIKAYTPRGNVWHSNDLTLKEYRHRLFDETVGLRKTGRRIKSPGIFSAVKAMLRDQLRIFDDRQYSKKRKLYWLIVNPLYHLQRWRGIQLGVHFKLDDAEGYVRHSLEASKAPRVGKKS